MSSVKKREYWSGNKRILSDVFWSFCLSLLLTWSSKSGYSDGLDCFIGIFSRTIGCFFLFFFWSWNKGHLKQGAARITVHLFAGFFFLAFTSMTLFFLYYSPTFLIKLAVPLAWFFGVVIKFRSLMKPDSKEIEVEASS